MSAFRHIESLSDLAYNMKVSILISAPKQIYQQYISILNIFSLWKIFDNMRTSVYVVTTTLKLQPFSWLLLANVSAHIGRFIGFKATRAGRLNN
jgi:hypothetical protein